MNSNRTRAVDLLEEVIHSSWFDSTDAMSRRMQLEEIVDNIIAAAANEIQARLLPREEKD